MPQTISKIISNCTGFTKRGGRPYSPSMLGSTLKDLWSFYDASKVVTQNAAKFTTSNALDGPTLTDTTKFTLSFWRKPYLTSGSLPSDCAFMGNAVYSNANGFSVASDDGTWSGRGIRVWLPLAAGWGGATIQARCDTRSWPTSVGNYPWSHALIVYDGTQATDALKLKIYLDGTAQTVSFSAAGVPASLTMGSGVFKVGRISGLASYDKCNHAFNRIGYWGATALTSSDATTLWNSGTGKYYADMTAGEKTGLTHFWNCTETSGTRTASVGTNLTENGSVSYKELMKTWTNFAGTKSFVPWKFAGALTYSATGISNGPGWVGDNSFCAAEVASYTNSDSAGSVFSLASQNAWVSSNYDKGIWGFSDTASTTKYFFNQFFNTPTSTLTRKLRERNDASSFNTAMTGGSAGAYTANTAEWHEWAVESSNTVMRLNNTAQTVTDDGTGGNNKWFNAIPTGNRLTLGGFGSGDTTQGFADGKYGPLAITGNLTATQRRKLLNWLNRAYGVTLS